MIPYCNYSSTKCFIVISDAKLHTLVVTSSIRENIGYHLTTTLDIILQKHKRKIYNAMVGIRNLERTYANLITIIAKKGDHYTTGRPLDIILQKQKRKIYNAIIGIRNLERTCKSKNNNAQKRRSFYSLPSKWAIVQRKFYSDSDRFKRIIFLGNFKRYVEGTMLPIVEET